ncbi:hypothetical protein RclHR1_17110001, partial [Rhizophagus clarus]
RNHYRASQVCKRKAKLLKGKTNNWIFMVKMKQTT